MEAKDYPVTFGYGATDNQYYGPNAKNKNTYIGPYHRGDDREMPYDTPVIVNSTKIGLSGTGNGRYGSHLHIGKFVDGEDVNPQGQGFELEGARVISVADGYDDDPINAKYVRIQDASGAIWVYLHMSEVFVSVGQELNNVKEELEMTPEVQAAIDDVKKHVMRAEDQIEDLKSNLLAQSQGILTLLQNADIKDEDLKKNVLGLQTQVDQLTKKVKA